MSRTNFHGPKDVQVIELWLQQQSSEQVQTFMFCCNSGMSGLGLLVGIIFNFGQSYLPTTYPYFFSGPNIKQFSPDMCIGIVEI